MKKKLILFSLLLVLFFLLPPKNLVYDYCYFYSDYDNDEATQQQKEEFVVIDKFFEDLANQLFYEKHDSLLVKELLLLFQPQNKIILVSCLMCGYYGFFCEKKQRVTLFFELNMYRLGFLDESYIRTCFWGLKQVLNIDSEEAFLNHLKKMIDEYCSGYPCDGSDKRVFDKLITFTYSDRFLAGTKWED